jgi:hypothetical protein
MTSQSARDFVDNADDESFCDSEEMRVAFFSRRGAAGASFRLGF